MRDPSAVVSELVGRPRGALNNSILSVPESKTKSPKLVEIAIRPWIIRTGAGVPDEGGSESIKRR